MNNWSTSPLFQSPSCLHQPSYRLPNPSQTAAPLTCRGSRVRRRARAPGSRTGPGRRATWRSWLLELLPGAVDDTGARARLTGRRPAARPPFTGRRQCRRSTARGVRVPQPATATQLLAITLVRWMGVSCHWCHCHWALGVTGLSAGLHLDSTVNECCALSGLSRAQLGGGSEHNPEVFSLQLKYDASPFFA